MNTPSLSRLIVRNQVDLFCGPSDGGKYSLEEACSKCGTGAKRLDPLTIPRDQIPRDDIAVTLRRECIIGDRLSRVLTSRRISCLREVHDRATGDSLPVKELLPEATLPPFAAATNGYERSDSCPECGRDGYFDIPHVRLQIVYEHLDSSFFRYDLLATFEHFGLSRLRHPFEDSVFAAPLYLVSGRLAALLRGCKKVELEPVELR